MLGAKPQECNFVLPYFLTDLLTFPALTWTRPDHTDRTQCDGSPSHIFESALNCSVTCPANANVYMTRSISTELDNIPLAANLSNRASMIYEVHDNIPGLRVSNDSDTKWIPVCAKQV